MACLLRLFLIGQSIPKSLHKKQIDWERLIQTVYADARKLETLNERLITFSGTSTFLSYDLTALRLLMYGFSMIRAS